MRTIISRISQEFINEANSSPRMLEDLAAMEKYMSESYDGRTFVELLQNADDAGAKRVIAFTVDETLIVANDGRSFDGNDIMAICRSGASDKKRGSNIGYRGVGFKSTTTISTEIIIHSSEAYFTFSKSVCAKFLKMNEEKVPTVRIPFLYDERELSEKVQEEINKYKSQGFTTFFIFNNPNIFKFTNELKTFDEGWLLFLKSIVETEICCPNFRKSCKVRREYIKENDFIVGIPGKNKQWYIFTDEVVSIAFKYDCVKGVVPCDIDEAVFHCYLPTLDKTGYPFKVNADFSTDPSRKHIIFDEITKQSIESIQRLYVDSIERIVRTQDVMLYQIVALLTNHITLNSLVAQFEDGLLEKLKVRKWVPMNNGLMELPSKVRLFQKWIAHNGRMALIKISPQLSECTPAEEWLEFVDKIEVLLSNLGASELCIRDLAEIATQRSFVEHISVDLLSKIFVYSRRSLFQEENILERMLIPTQTGYVQLENIELESDINMEFIDGIKALLNAKEIDSLNTQYPALGALLKKKDEKRVKLGAIQDGGQNPISDIKSIAVNKWKTPIQNCMALESLSGFAIKNVERKSTEYDVISTSDDGEVFYITVKNVGTLSDEFKISESEYSAAKRYGEHYKIYLFSSESNKVEYTVIDNPVKSISMKHVVKEWEWLCNNNPNSYDLDNQEYEKENEQSFETNFDNMDGVQFEKFCAELLIKNGYEDITMTIGSGDQGIDIIAYKDQIKIGIQCKCYSSDIGNGAVQEVYAGKTFYKCHLGIVMTNKRFTDSAIKLAECNGVILWDRDMILKFIKRAM